MWIHRTTTRRLRALALAGSLTACAASAPPGNAGPRVAAGAGDDTETTSRARAREPRALDPHLDVDNLGARLGRYIDSIGAGFGAAYRASGIVVVSAGGTRVYEQAFGQADYESETDIDASTSFRIGSVTKLFTAVAIYQLAEQGKLSLDDPVSRHLADYPAVGAGITLRQLLLHTSGLPSYTRNVELMRQRDREVSPGALLETFSRLPLDFEPGSDFRFSDSGYALLGAVIEAVTGATYASHLQATLLAPNGLAHTTAGAAGADAASPDNAALGYRATPSGQRELVSPTHPSLHFASGDLRSSADDLLEWAEVLARREALSPEATLMLETPGQHRYAAAGFVRDRSGHRVIELAGEIDGFISTLLRVPDLDLAVVVLSNSAAFNAAPIADVALRCALGEPVEPLEKQRAIQLSTEVTARFLGTYQLGEGAVVELRRRKVPKKALRAMRSVRLYEEGETLLFKPIGQAPVVMNAISAGRFVLMGGKASLEVSLPPDDSEATHFILRQGPLELDYVRKARIRGKPQTPVDAGGLPPVERLP